jgi:hypothetical protein
MESSGLPLNSIFGAVLGRYLLAGFARDHSLVSAKAVIVADGYVSMLQLGNVDNGDHSRRPDPLFAR